MQYMIVAQRFTREGEWEGSRQVPSFIVEASSPREAQNKALEILHLDLGGALDVISGDFAEYTAICLSTT